MEKLKSVDRDILIPAGIGLISIFGMGIIFLIARPGQPQEIVPTDPIETPFKYLLLATETPIQSAEPETSTPTAGPPSTTGTSSIAVAATDLFDTTPTFSASRSTPGQLSTATLSVSTLPGATNTPVVDVNVTIPAGTYDDIDERIIYDGEWISEIFVDGAYQETLFISTAIASTAEFTFIGEQVKIGYFGDPELGTITIIVDTVENLVDQSTGAEWSSPELPYGEHSVTIIHQDGDYIVLDYITVVGSP